MRERKGRSLKDELTINQFVSEDIHRLRRTPNAFSHFFTKLKIPKRSDKKFNVRLSKTHDVGKRMSARKTPRPREIANPETLKLNHCDQDAAVHRPVSPPVCNAQEKNEEISCDTETFREHQLPSVAVNIHHSDSELHDQAPHTNTKTLIKKSHIPRARRPGVITTSRSSRLYSMTQYPIRGSTRSLIKKRIVTSLRIKQPAQAPVEIIVNVPPEKEPSYDTDVEEAESKLSDDSDVGKAESKSSHSTDIRKAESKSSHNTEVRRAKSESSVEIGVERAESESSDETDIEEPLEVESTSSQHEEMTSDAGSMLVQRSSKFHCVHCPCKAQRLKKGVVPYCSIETTSEDSSSSSNSSDTESISDVTELSSPESSPPKQRKVRSQSRVRVARSTARIKPNLVTKSSRNLKQRERGRYGFFRTLFDIVFWPFLFFRTEK